MSGKMLRLGLINMVVFAALSSTARTAYAGLVQCPYHEACPALLCCCIKDSGAATCVGDVQECTDFCGNGGGAVFTP